MYSSYQVLGVETTGNGASRNIKAPATHNNDAGLLSDGGRAGQYNSSLPSLLFEQL
jgi:hypothetical protein